MKEIKIDEINTFGSMKCCATKCKKPPQYYNYDCGNCYHYCGEHMIEHIEEFLEEFEHYNNYRPIEYVKVLRKIKNENNKKQ